MRSRPGTTVVFMLACLAAAPVVIWAPQSHNPDGNFYFGFALRLAQGRFSASVDGLYPPLLSWLMAPLAALGAPLWIAYRIVNGVAFAATIALCASIGARMQLPAAAIVAACTLTAVHLLYFITALVTPDILAAACFLAAIAPLLGQREPAPAAAARSALFGALSYFAKAIELPIFAACVMTVAFMRKKTRRRSLINGACICLLALTITAPWMAAISAKHGRLIFSAQQLVHAGELLVADYAPDAPVRSAAGSHAPPPGSPATAERLLARYLPNFSKTADSIQLFCEISCGLLFGYFGCAMYAALLLAGLAYALRMRRCRAGDPGATASIQVATVIIIHSIAYFSIWSPYIRYHFPVLPLLHLCFFSSIAALARFLFSRYRGSDVAPIRAIPFLFLVMVAIALAGIALTTARSVADDWRSKDDAVITRALAIPEISAAAASSDTRTQECMGAVTGNGEDPYAGMIAYHLHREYWGSIFPSRLDTARDLSKRLSDWGVTLILWIGEPLAVLEQLPELRKRGRYRIHDRYLTYYVRTGPPC